MIGAVEFEHERSDEPALASPDASPAGSSPGADTDNRLGALVVPLLRGVIYRDEDPRRWQSLLELQSRVRDHVAVVALELVLDESEGHAFLRSRARDEDDEATTAVPRLIPRRPLSFPVSLLLALLRRRLVEFDTSGTETRLVLTRSDIVEMLRLFLPDASDEARLVDQVDTHLNKVVELRFVRKLKAGREAGTAAEPRYEVLRIIRAFVDAEWLDDFDSRLAAYATALAAETDSAEEPTDTTASDADGSKTGDPGTGSLPS